MSVYRLGLICDPHLGLKGRPTYHNLLLGDRAPQLVRSAVDALKREQVNAVLALGDLTNSGTAEEMETACSLLSALDVPWWVTPGNHDAAAVASGVFRELFAGHIAEGALTLGDIFCLCPWDVTPGAGPDSSTFLIGQAQMTRLLDSVRSGMHKFVLLATHAPVIDASAPACRHSAAYAGHFSDGREIVDALHALGCERILLCSGHTHYHWIETGPGWVQCVTGALIAYPMEIRIVEFDQRLIRIRTVAVTTGELRKTSLLSAEWTAGRPQDRSFEP